MNKKIYLMSIVIILFAFQTNAQPWNKLLPQNKSKTEYSFHDYQKAFNDYWKPLSVDNGWYINTDGNKEKAMGWKQFKRWEEHWSSRVDQRTGEFPKTNAAVEFKKLIAKNGNYPKSQSNWINLGPSYNSNMADTLNLGRVNIIEFHPTKLDTMWVGTPSGGLWVTYNGGENWTPLTDHLDVLGVSAIIVPPDYDASQTIYIGTGDRDAYDNSSTGIYKSTDGGNSWVQTSLTFEPQFQESVNRMLLLPSDNQTIYTATSNGVYKTIDGADTWTQLETIEFIDMEFCPSNSSIIYGVTRNGAIYTSTDAGINWVNVFSTNTGRMEIAVSEDASNIVYVVGVNSNSGLEGIYRSDDYGQTYSLIFDDYNILSWDQYGSGSSGQAWYDLCLAADPTNANIVYCGGVNTWRSNDSGETWELVNHMTGSGGVQVVHADQHYLKFWHNTDKLFECNDGGVFVSDNGTEWDNISNTLTIGQLYRLDVATSDNLLTLIGMQDNGFKRYSDEGWYDLSIFADGMECVIDYEDNNVQYASSQYGNINRTTNNWASYTNIASNIPGGANGAWVTPYILCPEDHNTLYVGYSDLWKSTDQGNSFTSIASFGSNLKSLTTSPVNPDYLYAATNSTIYMSSDRGESWQNITSGLPTSSATINYISVKYNDPQTFWVSLGGYNEHGVYETKDGGQSWINISAGLPDIPVNCVIQNQIETLETQLYAATDYKVFVKNGESDWTLYANGLPNVIVRELDIFYNYENPSSSKLRAATYGRGLWESNLELSNEFGVMLTTNGSGNITLTSANLMGEIIHDLGTTITKSGFVISNEPNPEIGSPNTNVLQTSPLVTTGSFSISTTELQPASKYYFRSYATNENGTAYGEEMTFVTDCDVIATFPLFEDLESSLEIPVCWAEEFVSGDNLSWQIEAGNGTTVFPNAHSGSNNFLLKDANQGENKTLMKLPIIDISDLEAPALKFWLAQPSFFGTVDELKVLYKAAENDSWVELGVFNEEASNWTEKYFQLPNASSSYHIAFEGNAIYGGGICIDDISIVESAGISDISEEGIAIFPNPTKEVLNIEIEERIIGAKFNLVDLSGKSLIKKQLKSKTNKIDVQSLSAGIYIVKIETAEKTIKSKIIVE